MKLGTYAVVGSVALIIPAAIGLLSKGGPTVIGPLPAMTVLPAMLLSSRVVAVLLPSLFFLLWNPGLLRGEGIIPRRSYALFAALGILTILWFALGWKNGVLYQGHAYVHKLSILNAFCVAILSWLFIRYRTRSCTFVANLSLHWFLFAWLAWFAFPYLGELP